MLRVSSAVVALSLMTLGACRTTKPDSEVKDATTVAAVPPAPGLPVTPYKAIVQDSFEPEVEALPDDELTVCSFNVSFVGHWKARDKRSADLAQLLQPCDIVAVQELVAPPTGVGLDANGDVHTWLNQDKLLKRETAKDPNELVEGFTPWWTDTTRPQGIVEEWEGDYQALHFVGKMKEAGWEYVLSSGDTGKSLNHNNSTSSEWHIAFYRANKVMPVSTATMPGGWTRLDASEPLATHPVFDRVPYAFAFRTQPRADGKQLDFVLINVHLHSTQSRINENEKQAGEARAKELVYIRQWIEKMNAQYTERDFITLGDMNIASCKQMEDVRADVQNQITALGLGGANNYMTLNNSCQQTNISENEPKPFDQVIFDKDLTKEIVKSKSYGADLIVVDIAKKFGLTTTFNSVVGNFVKSYSDHLPIMFVMKIGQDDD